MDDHRDLPQEDNALIKDSASPQQGPRDQNPAGDPVAQRQRRILGVKGVAVEAVSGTGGVEPTNGQASGPADSDALSSNAKSTHGSKMGDGVSSLDSSAASPGGESSGAPYPTPYKQEKPRNDFGSYMGHGGQSGIAYHGPGHLGEDVVDDKKNRNGVTETNS